MLSMDNHAFSFRWQGNPAGGLVATVTAAGYAISGVVTQQPDGWAGLVFFRRPTGVVTWYADGQGYAVAEHAASGCEYAMAWIADCARRGMISDVGAGYRPAPAPGRADLILAVDCDATAKTCRCPDCQLARQERLQAEQPGNPAAAWEWLNAEGVWRLQAKRGFTGLAWQGSGEWVIYDYAGLVCARGGEMGVAAAMRAVNAWVDGQLAVMALAESESGAESVEDVAAADLAAGLGSGVRGIRWDKGQWHWAVYGADGRRRAGGADDDYGAAAAALRQAFQDGV